MHASCQVAATVPSPETAISVRAPTVRQSRHKEITFDTDEVAVIEQLK